ncbi:MAG: hypothetical protein SFX74_08580 [Fimbriimonadaceae bacterium]|nr:hypothetical protein [Fimbriimonadaceae bacterium]
MDRWREWLGATLVVFAISERTFWAYIRADDLPHELLITMLAYGVIVAGALALRRILAQPHGRSNPQHPILIGALVGWLAEGAIVNTAYGQADNPFPLSIAWTGVAWHALLSWVVGVECVPKWLHQWNSFRLAIFATTFGAGWGFWSTYYPPSVYGTESFIRHTALTSALLIGGWTLLAAGPARPGRFERGTAIAVGLIGLALMLGVWMPMNPFPVLVLLGIILATLAHLFGTRRREPVADVAEPVAEIGPWRFATLALVPISAIAVHLGVRAALPNVETAANIVLYIVLMFAGSFTFFRSWRLAAKTPAEPPYIPAPNAIQ